MRSIFHCFLFGAVVKPRTEILFHRIFVAVLVAATGAICQTPRLFVERGDPVFSSSSISERSIRSVAMNKTALESESIEIPLGGDTLAVVLTRDSLRKNEQGYMVWRGSSKSDSHESATILEKDGNFRGILRSRAGNFVIRPLRQGEHILVRMGLEGVRECAH
jgi:hypothetical protein